jgi:nicotinamidase-related amidase
MEDNLALLVIDMQYGLLQREVFNKLVLTNNVNRLLAFFHEQNKAVFLIRHTNTSFSQENSDDWQIYKRSEIIRYMLNSSWRVFEACGGGKVHQLFDVSNEALEVKYENGHEWLQEL